MDGIPTNVQARIAAIVSRFEPARLNAASTEASTATDATGSGGTTGSTGMAGFADVLADAVTTVGANDGSISMDMTLGQLLAAATASRNAALGGRYSTTSSGAGAVAASGPIATTSEVKALEGRYQNGRLPAEALAPIGVGNHRLAPPAANAFQQMRAAAAADGVEIGVTDSYRSYDAQVDVARRKGLYSQGGLAARPGTSDHGLGLALDLKLDSRALSWIRANGSKFGFVEDTPRESWHWKFDGV